MPTYVISDVKFLDQDLIERYRPLAAASIEKFGGRYLVRGGDVECVEGARDPQRRLVVVEFPDMARAWYASADYAEALKVRNAGALERTLVFVEGA